MAEAEPLVSMQTDQFAIDTDWRRTSRKAKHNRATRGGAFANQGGNASRHKASHRFVLINDDRRDTLADRLIDVGVHEDRATNARRPAAQHERTGLQTISGHRGIGGQSHSEKSNGFGSGRERTAATAAAR